MQTDLITIGGFLGLVFALGMRHGFDPDHIAVIDGFTRFNVKNRPVLARRCGLLFSAGHMIVVLGLVLLLAWALDHWQPPEWLQFSGKLVSIAFLFLLGVLNIGAALHGRAREMVRTRGVKARVFGGVAGDSGIIGVGMLFALSLDTVSQATLMAIVGSKYGMLGPLIGGACFGAGMFLTAGITGLWVARMSAFADARAAAASRLTTFAIGCASLVLSGLLGGSILSQSLAEWIEIHGLGLSLGMTGSLAALFVACLVYFRSSTSPEPAVDHVRQ